MRVSRAIVLLAKRSNPHRETPRERRFFLSMAKFNKKDFTLVPSRQARIGMPANQQVVYMWLAEHSDDNNQSFPSRKVLAYECGISPSTLDRTLLELINKGFIVRENRYKENKQVSNLYTVLIVTKGIQDDEGGVFNMTSPPIQIDAQNPTHRTLPIRTKEINKEKEIQKISESSKSVLFPELQPALDSYMEMRRLIRKPATPRALELVVDKLRKLYPDNPGKQQACLDQSTANSWQGIFAIKDEKPLTAVDSQSVHRMLYPDKYKGASAFGSDLAAGMGV